MPCKLVIVTSGHQELAKQCLLPCTMDGSTNKILRNIRSYVLYACVMKNAYLRS